MPSADDVGMGVLARDLSGQPSVVVDPPPFRGLVCGLALSRVFWVAVGAVLLYLYA
jgi:hypothetical protein